MLPTIGGWGLGYYMLIQFFLLCTLSVPLTLRGCELHFTITYRIIRKEMWKYRQSTLQKAKNYSPYLTNSLRPMVFIPVYTSVSLSPVRWLKIFDCHSRSLASNSEVASKYVGQLGVPVKTEVKIKFNSSSINIQNPFGLNGVWSRHQLVFISTYTLTKMLPPYFPSF